jgi:Phage integrase family
MAPQPQGGIAVETQGDGTLAFRLRFRAYGKRRTAYLHERRDCDCGCGGGWNERTAAVELENVLARVKAGVWEPPRRRSQPAGSVNAATATFRQYSSRWLQARIDTTPHTLRRTYISITLLANNFDVKWAMDQVGHANSKMTMDVYAQLQQRAKRDHGDRFDELVRKARRHLNETSEPPAEQLIGTAIGTEAQKQPPKCSTRRRSAPSKPADLQPIVAVGDPGFEPGTSSLSEKRSNQLS